MIEIRRLKKEDIETILPISLKALGEDYLSEADFVEAIDADGLFCNVIIYDGEAAGFGICKYFPPSEEKIHLDLPDCPERDEIMRMRMIGLIDSVSVNDAMRGKGLGTALVSECIEDLKEKGCDYICAMANKKYNTGTMDIGGILKKSGFEETIAIQGYWNRWVSSPEGHHCPDCGPPCKCYGVLLKKVL